MWGVREEPSYEEARAALGIDIKRVDEALEGVTWAIARAGHDDKVCPEVHKGIRLARAKSPDSSDHIIRVWFVLDQASGNACLIYIDVVAASKEEDDAW